MGAAWLIEAPFPQQCRDESVPSALLRDSDLPVINLLATGCLWISAGMACWSSKQWHQWYDAMCLCQEQVQQQETSVRGIRHCLWRLLSLTGCGLSDYCQPAVNEEEAEATAFFISSVLQWEVFPSLCPVNMTQVFDRCSSTPAHLQREYIVILPP